MIVLFLHMEIRSVLGSAGMCSVHVLGKSTFVLNSLHVSLVSSKFYTIVYILFLIDNCTVVYIFQVICKSNFHDLQIKMNSYMDVRAMNNDWGLQVFLYTMQILFFRLIQL